MTRYCEDCRHWKRDVSTAKPSIPWGVCQRGSGFGLEADDAKTLAFAIVFDVDTAKRAADMRTNQHFGCIQWASK